MRDQQLSFLSAEPAAFDVNSVDDPIIRPVTAGTGSAATLLSQTSVDDWVLGLGFTNWKTLIDHALQSGHYELHASVEGHVGLRKHGYRYGPIPRLPVGGSAYIQQRLLMISSTRNAVRGRQERLITAGPDFAYKVVIVGDLCDLTVKQGGDVTRCGIEVGNLAFDDQLVESSLLAEQLTRILASAGAREGGHLEAGCKSLASHITRMTHGVR